MPNTNTSAFSILEDTVNDPWVNPRHVAPGCREHDGVILESAKGVRQGGGEPAGFHQPLPSKQREVGETRIEPGCMYQVKFHPPMVLPERFGEDRFMYEAKLMAYETRDEVRLGFLPEKGKIPRAGWRLSAFSEAKLVQ